MRIAVRAIINHCSRKLQNLRVYTLISRLLSSVGDPRHSFSLDLMHYMTPTYCFIRVDINVFGKNNDSEIFKESAAYTKLTEDNDKTKLCYSTKPMKLLVRSYSGNVLLYKQTKLSLYSIVDDRVYFLYYEQSNMTYILSATRFKN